MEKDVQDQNQLVNKTEWTKPASSAAVALFVRLLFLFLIFFIFTVLSGLGLVSTSLAFPVALAFLETIYWLNSGFWKNFGLFKPGIFVRNWLKSPLNYMWSVFRISQGLNLSRYQWPVLSFFLIENLAIWFLAKDEILSILVSIGLFLPLGYFLYKTLVRSS